MEQSFKKVSFPFAITLFIGLSNDWAKFLERRPYSALLAWIFFFPIKRLLIEPIFPPMRISRAFLLVRKWNILKPKVKSQWCEGKLWENICSFLMDYSSLRLLAWPELVLTFIFKRVCMRITRNLNGIKIFFYLMTFSSKISFY